MADTTQAPQPVISRAPDDDVDIVVENIPLEFDGYVYKHSWIAYVRGRPPSPVVLIHPNYAGLKQFDIDQARFLARRGYVGLTVDTYKDEPGKYTFEDHDPSPPTGPDDAARIKAHYDGAIQAWNGLLLNPRHWRGLLRKYVETAFAHPAVAAGKAGAIGYCAGGQAVLEQVRNGDPIQAAVTFHGLLHSRPMHLDRIENGYPTLYTVEEFRALNMAPNTYTKDCTVLVENGGADKFVTAEHITDWSQEFSEQNIDWRLTTHGNTDHGFALPGHLIGETYNEAADRRSTLAMLSLLQEVWPEHQTFPVDKNACGTTLGILK